MSMLDSFLTRGFKASKCKTLLKLTIPRIKLLRNRKELSIKQMRRDIAKLLENGQEATARIRVEHIIREENMMAAQEIIELFCELIAVRLPIIEAQRECPLDLKEAISSVCFAAPRCADLPELMQVQMAFAGKYGKEFVAAATELMPSCGVNRQLIELLSVRAPSPEKKLKLLKEIAEEHELDWDPAPSESELFKSHEDLLNGPAQFVSGSNVPLPDEKHDEILQSVPAPGAEEHSDSEDRFDQLEFPEVPKVSLRRGADAEVAPSQSSALPPEFPHATETCINADDNTLHDAKPESPKSVANPRESKQFLPFISPPSPSLSLPPVSLAGRENSKSPSPLTAKMDDLQDILAAAKAAAESAERAAAAARSAASLAEVKISKLAKNQNGQSFGGDVENPFYGDAHNLSEATGKLHLDDRNGMGNVFENPQTPIQLNQPTYIATELGSKLEDDALKPDVPCHQPQRIPSMDDDPSFTYPNLFSPAKSHSPDNSQPGQGL